MEYLYSNEKLSARSTVSEQSNAPVHQLNSIQLLRGVAAILVVAYHLSLFSGEHYKQVKLVSQLFGYGYAGVDLFFVISGFVITYSTFSKNRKPPGLLKYTSKRLIRIFPIYWAMVLVFWIACKLTYGAVPQADRPIADWLTAFFLIPTHLPIIPVSWSLSHELFFYFLIGLVLYSHNLWVVLGLVVAGTVYQLFSTPSIKPLIWFVFSPYNLEFLGGVGVALLSRINSFPKTVYWALLLMSIVWLFIGPAVDPGNPAVRLVLFGVSSIGVLLALTGLETSRHIIVGGAFTKLGDASYIIYLIHPSALVFLYKFFEKHPSLPFWAFACAAIALLVIVSQVSILIHYKLEKPVLNRLNKLVSSRLS
ncbi:acyltransferase family protein [Spirosoma pollinicola]|uniref:Acyltransferase 3 domain-containing protein n=1 Tax=Spirosoma pollinicola TaxID=2057025 RepID=A0A2K8YYX7_9BACT|nr:acyltransferase [Spirosoma pollinicola]AUD02799.1 hypothetical protein CWM47_13725 [Spirosoma pollinicola]